MTEDDTGYFSQHYQKRFGTFVALQTIGCLALCGVCMSCQQNGTSAIDAHAQSVSAQVEVPNPVRGLARLEPKNGLILVGATPGRRILSIEVEQGQQVQRGDLLATLEGHEQALQQLALAKAEKKAADFQLQLQSDKLQLQRQRFDRLRDERLRKQRELVDILKEKLEVAVSNRERVTGIDPTADRIAVQDYVINQTKGELLQAQLQLLELETDLDLLSAQRQLEDRELAANSPQQQLLNEKIRLAEAGVDQTMIRAPADGWVLDTLARAGEVSTGPLLYLGDTSQMVAVVELFQTDVASIAIGDRATVEIFDQKIPATVIQIGKIVGENQLTSVNPMELTDRRVVKVRLQLQESQFASQYVNMQVSAVIHPGRKDG